jgi:DNA polymerase-3 subunit gamma/tau
VPPTKNAPAPVLDADSEARAAYTVVARRYRPQRFDDVVGQDHVVQTLRNAIRLDRVAQAYLFCGTRGVGKTSMARIFAKCLNCVHGPTDEPCQVCDICQAITVGQDVDVIEIDGASNNGVEAVRELRQNASLRPSRARYKIYYIDEVHMLTTQAFNALLKTLEEPPGHVKFFFATTEANKIPITVLSRCQRYDFAGITPEQIVETLAGICTREGVQAEPDALRTVARRAGGSMRDAQSLLEQLLSAGGERLTVELVHGLLGTASDERLLDLLDALADHDAAAVLRQVDRAASEGVQPADLLGGLIDYLRDLMVLAVGAETLLLAATPSQKPRLEAVARRWTVDSVVAALQILAEARGRLRGSTHGRTLVELALVRVARLEDLAELGAVVARLSALERGDAPATDGVKKKLAAAEPAAPWPPLGNDGAALEPPPRPVQPPVAPTPPPDPAAPPPLDLQAVLAVWATLITRVGVRLGMPLSRVGPTAVEPPNVLAITLPPGYNWVADECDPPESREKIEQILGRLLHQRVRVRFDRSSEADAPAPAAPASNSSRGDELAGDPMIQKVVELFEARPIHLEMDEEGPAPGA